LLRDFLTELLILFERDHRLLAEIEDGELGGGQIMVSGRSAPLDMEASTFFREVKAITYHDLELRRVETGFEARLIVDI
jgi:SHS2 domain-containing protein